MDLKQMRYFVHISELESFNKAAQVLRIAQPALSRQVKLLEEEVGVTLLERSSRGVKATAAGEQFARASQRILSLVEMLRAEMLEFKDGRAVNGCIGIGMPQFEGFLLSCPMIELAAQSFPQLSLRLVEGFSSLLPEWLLAGSVDIALLYGSKRSSLIDGISILREDLFLIAAPNSELAGLYSVEATDLHSLTLALPHRPHATRELLDANGIEIANLIEADSIDLILHHVAQRQAYTLLPIKQVKRQVEEGSVMAYQLSEPGLSRIVSICWQANTPKTAAFSASVQLLMTAAQRMVASGHWPGKLIQSKDVDPLLPLPGMDANLHGLLTH